MWKCFMFIYIITTASSVYTQNTCITPDRKPGKCVDISECPELKKISQNMFPSRSQITLLKKSICDRSSKICCENRSFCATPDNHDGECVDINDCDSLKVLLRPNSPDYISRFLNESLCSPADKSKVCCDKKEVPCVTHIKEPSAEIEDLLPKRTECGKEDPSSRIVGGTVAELNQFPWMGLIEYSKKNVTHLGCGSSLISKRYVLTAAHCVVGAAVKALGTPTNIRFGEYNVTNDGIDCIRLGTGENDIDCTNGTTQVAIEKIIIHPCYKDSLNDIAIIRLQSEVTFSDFIQPICLPTSDITIGLLALNLTISGWGATETSRFSDVKMFADVPFVQLESCKKIYEKTIKLFTRQICAGGVLGQDSCRGDSGGPLMHTKDYISTIVGIVSFGSAQCAKSVPTVYTNVASYTDWIKGEIKP